MANALSPAAVALAGLVVCAAASLAPAQEVGGKVVVTLDSGSKITAVLVSRNDDEVVVRTGDSTTAIPASMVVSVEAVGGPTPAKAAPTAPAAPAEGGTAPVAPAPGGGAPGGSKMEGVPEPAKIMLKDGQSILGWVLSRSGGKLWIAQVPARGIPLDSIDRVVGSAEPLEAGGGGRLTGDDVQDAMRMMKEIESGDRTRMKVAMASVTALGEAAAPALLKSLESTDPNIRLFCMTALEGLRSEGIHESFRKALRTDPEVMVRATAAEKLMGYDSPIVRRDLLDAAWRDRDDRVKASAIAVLARTATPEEAPALMDLLNILPSESAARPGLFDALRRASGQSLASTEALWTEWWQGEGREIMLARIEQQQKRRQEDQEAAERRKFGPEQPAPEPEPAPAPESEEEPK